MKELSTQEALGKTEHLCSVSECCPYDLQKKMDKWGISQQAQKDIILRLKEERYIDEERYCRSFVRDKFKYNQWGRIKIVQALRLKEIPDSFIKKALEEIDESEYDKVLQHLLGQKRRNIKASSEYEQNGKLIRFALGRGFEMSHIMKCLHVEEDFT